MESYSHDILIIFVPSLVIPLMFFLVTGFAISAASKALPDEHQHFIPHMEKGRRRITLGMVILMLAISMLYGPNTYKNDTTDYQEHQYREMMMEERAERAKNAEITLEGIKQPRENHEERAERTASMLDWRNRDE